MSTSPDQIKQKEKAYDEVTQAIRTIEAKKAVDQNTYNNDHAINELAKQELEKLMCKAHYLI